MGKYSNLTESEEMGRMKAYTETIGTFHHSRMYADSSAYDSQGQTW
jgi:hypothetical protein